MSLSVARDIGESLNKEGSGKWACRNSGCTLGNSNRRTTFPNVQNIELFEEVIFSVLVKWDGTPRKQSL